MKLLIILPSSLRGGAEEYALILASAAAQEGGSIEVCFPQTDKNHSLISDFNQIGGRCHKWREVKGFDPFSTYLRYAFQFFQTLILYFTIRPDIVLINLSYPDSLFGAVLACALLRVPTLLVFHVLPRKMAINRVRVSAYQWALSRNQTWVTVSQYCRNLISESLEVDQNDILVIYNGTRFIDVIRDSTSEIEALRQRVRKRLHISAEAQIAITVGRLVSQKGYQDLIPVIPRLCDEFPRLKFVWAGEGEEREKFETDVYRHNVQDRVIFLGHCADIFDLLRAADLFVYPTHFEGLPFALLEAMACGVPVIASNASSIPEVITHHVDGLLFQVGNGDELLEAVRWALRNPQDMKLMAEKASVRVKAFSQASMLDKTLRVIKNMAHI